MNRTIGVVCLKEAEYEFVKSVPNSPRPLRSYERTLLKPEATVPFIDWVKTTGFEDLGMVAVECLNQEQFDEMFKISKALSEVSGSPTLPFDRWEYDPAHRFVLLSGVLSPVRPVTLHTIIAENVKVVSMTERKELLWAARRPYRRKKQRNK